MFVWCATLDKATEGADKNGKKNTGQKKHRRPAGRRRPGAPKRRAVSGLPVRMAAVEVLTRILSHGETLDKAFGALAGQDNMAGMEHRDRALVRLIVTTVLRRRGQIRDVIGRYLDKPLPKRSGSVRLIMDVAAAQILFLQTPPHAAINIAVEQCRQDRRGGHLAKLANAVLRRVSEFGAEIIATQDGERLNTPDWLWGRWCADYGEVRARELAKAHQSGPGLDISVKADPETWAEKLDGELLPGGTVRVDLKGRVEDLPGYDEGEWWVQDVAASLPAKLLGNVDGLRVADLCAAPGGKTALLAAMGAHVTAVDNSEHRLLRLRENVERLGLEVDVVQADVMNWMPEELFDAVLLDAPCSATGTIRRHPDILHVKRPADAEELAIMQYQMLVRATDFLKVGGRLVFCTCSLEGIEGEKHLETIARDLPQLEFEPVNAMDFGWPDEWITAAGYLRTLPQYMQNERDGFSGMDGFFAAKFVKNANSAP